MNSKIGVSIVAGVVFLVCFFWYVTAAGPQAVGILTSGLIAVVILAAGAVAVTLALFVWRGFHRGVCDRAGAITAMAQARRAVRDAEYSYITAGPQDQVFINETDHTKTWRSGHQDPRVIAHDGQWSEPSKVEIGAYLARLESMRPVGKATAESLLEPAQQVTLMSEIADMERALIVGGSGSGKTTVLQHMIGQREGQTIVIDPHDDGVTWPDHCQVVAGAQNYQEAEQAILWVVEEIQRRYTERHDRGTQPDGFEMLTLVIDEWRELVLFGGKELPEGMKKALTAGRKVRMCLILAGHSERVRALGIREEGDLIGGFSVIRLQGGAGKPYSATLDVGQGEIPVVLPGPFVPGIPAPATRPMLELGNDQLPQTAQETQIIGLHQAGHSISRIGKEVYGNRGGWQSDRVREVLKKFSKT